METTLRDANDGLTWIWLSNIKVRDDVWKDAYTGKQINWNPNYSGTLFCIQLFENYICPQEQKAAEIMQ